MSKSNLVSPLEVECLPGQIGEVLYGQAVEEEEEEEETIRRLEISYLSFTFKALPAYGVLPRSLQDYSSSHISLFPLFILQRSFFEKLSTPLHLFCATLIRNPFYPCPLFLGELLHYSPFESKES